MVRTAFVSAVMFMTARSASSEGTCVLQTAGFPFGHTRS
jgi:hypothetical protein